ncbi:uncharacterized protein LOC106151163 [Lingula anatina]|uniref:Uncharacterized protein LOC106151163 n=1 Tax=Lingula anatina TaxID=7574 RepID=A0A1S3H3K9_LINAN|nr:uncharacterized protein LOC106151163 [Lingula anatina]|eukprot:XP_013379724.1 uncharacterized protein LOC106151163 [Lingula anatina]
MTTSTSVMRRKRQQDLLPPLSPTMLPPPTQRYRHANAPLSLDGVKRKATAILDEVKRETLAFKRQWFVGIDDDKKDKWLEYIEDIVCRVRSDKNSTVTLQSFVYLVDNMNQDKYDHLLQKPENEELRMLNQKHNELREFRSIMQGKLKTAIIDNLVKFCISFAEEADEFDSYPVREYEDTTIEIKHQIDENFERLEVLEKEMADISTSIQRFVDELDKIMILVDDMANTFLALSKIGKQWIVLDDGYDKRVLCHIKLLEQHRLDTQNQIKLERQNNALSRLAIKRKQFETGKVEDVLHQQEGALEKLHLQRCNAIGKKRVLQTKLEEKEDCLGELNFRFMKSESTTPLAIKKHAEETALLKAEIEALRAEILQGNRQIQQLKRNEVHLDCVTDDIKIFLKHEHKAECQLSKSIGHQKSDIKYMTSCLARVSSELRALKRIKAFREDPETVKKIFHGSIRPRTAGPLSNKLRAQIAARIRQDLDRVFSGVPRTSRLHNRPDYKQEEIRVFDIGEMRGDARDKAILDQCVNMWRDMNRTPDIKQIVSTWKHNKSRKQHTSARK